MRIRPFISSVAMLALLGGVLRWIGGGWLHVIVIVAAVVLFAFLLTRAYRNMFDDDLD